MAILKCKMCGANLEVTEQSTVAECEYCGTPQTLPKLGSDQRAARFDRAGHFRRSSDFDKAAALYEQILAEDTTDAEAYWSLVLCRFGIEYVEDPATKKRVPTVNRTQRTSIFEDANYKSALQYADEAQKKLYEKEAAEIHEIQKGILTIVEKEDPFDVFICYKESDENKNRTHDSVLAQELYYGLTNAGFKVFFARITLEKKLGEQFEPYIFAALMSSKVMVVLGTKPEYFNAVWVKNEWSRFLHMAAEDPSKKLIPAYKGMDPYDLPEELSLLQSQDMSKLGFMQDLIAGIEKIAGKEKEVPAPAAAQQTNASTGIKPLLTRAFMFLEDGNWPSAQEYAEKVLDMSPECADAYVVKLCADLRVKNVDALKNQQNPFDNNLNFQKALRFSEADQKAKLNGIITLIRDRNEEERKQSIYSEAAQLYARATYQRDFDAAAELFAKIPGYKDADERKKTCRREGEVARKEAIYVKAKECYNSTTPSVILSSKEKFLSIADYKDSSELASTVAETAERAHRANLCKSARQALQASVDKNRLFGCIRDMEGIAGSDPDAADLAARLQAKIAEIENKERLAREEKERREAQIRLEAKKRKNRERNKKLFKFALIAACIAGIALSIYYFFWLKPSGEYDKAYSMMMEEDWDGAIDILEDLKFRDSKALLMECKAEKGTDLAEEGSFDDAFSVLDEIKYIYSNLDLDDQADFEYRYKKCNYMHGEALLMKEGNEKKAAVKFGIAIGYEDAKERSLELHSKDRKIDHVVIGIRSGATNSSHEGVALLHTDGTVTSVHGSPEFRSTIGSWTNIVEIAACPDYLAAIDKDGNLFIASYYNFTKNISGWENIIDIDASSTHNVLYGVRADGKVLYADDDNTDGAVTEVPFDYLENEVLTVSVGQHHVACLTSKGGAIAWNRSSYNDSATQGIEGWTDLVKVECSDNYIYAVKADGTVTTNNTSYLDQLTGSGQYAGKNEWTDIVDIRIASGFHPIWGLKADGTLVNTESNSDGEWKSWTGITCFDVYQQYVVAEGEGGKLFHLNYGEFTEEGIH